jgi:hypothetical protein
MQAVEAVAQIKAAQAALEEAAVAVKGKLEHPQTELRALPTRAAEVAEAAVIVALLLEYHKLAAQALSSSATLAQPNSWLVALSPSLVVMSYTHLHQQDSWLR